VQLAICWKPRVSGATTRVVVTMRPVRTISRKGRRWCSSPSTVSGRQLATDIRQCRNPQRPYASHLASTGETKIWS
jgi:hypothetical protein